MGTERFQELPGRAPDTGIVHQINLEYLAHVVFLEKENGEAVLYPDTLVGTDSHTTMINAMGIVGWGVGGIEAEGAMLGCPISMLIPEVVASGWMGCSRRGPPQPMPSCESSRCSAKKASSQVRRVLRSRHRKPFARRSCNDL